MLPPHRARVNGKKHTLIRTKRNNFYAMVEIEKEQKAEIEKVQEQVHEVKNEFLHITEILHDMEHNSATVETLSFLYQTVINSMYTVEEVGKKASVLFSNKSIEKDSTELCKFFYQTALKLEALKESLQARDRTTFSKHLSLLKRSLVSAEYVLSLFIGEVTAELTEITFRQFIEGKKREDLMERVEALDAKVVSLNTRVETYERKVSLLVKNNPESVLETDEAMVIKEIRSFHDQNVMWVEPRFIENNLSLSKNRIDEILDVLTRYGILQYKMRGGTKVYKYGESHDINTN